MRRWSLLSKTTKSNTLFIPINLISDSGKVGRAENIHTIVLHAMSSLSWASEIHASSTLVVQRSPFSIVCPSSSSFFFSFSLLRVCFIHIIYLYSLSIVVGESSYY